MAYVSIRVTPQSTVRTVVLEVLPLLGRQVCMLVLPSPVGQAVVPVLAVMPTWEVRAGSGLIPPTLPPTGRGS